MNEDKIKECGYYSFSRISYWCRMGHIPTPTVYFKKPKIEITAWYKNLSKQDKEYTNILIREAIDEEQFFSQGD